MIYIFHWYDGKTDTIEAQNVQQAFTKLGYGAGAIQALDYFEEK